MNESTAETDPIYYSGCQRSRPSAPGWHRLRAALVGRAKSSLEWEAHGKDRHACGQDPRRLQQRFFLEDAARTDVMKPP
jgi:hypothetical protein